MRILIVLHDYLPLHTGGSEVHAHQSAAELARRGHDVTSLFTERDLEREEGSLRVGEMDGVRTIEVVHQREYADVRDTWEEEGSLAILRAQLDELKPDIVHFHHLAIWGSGAIRAARDAGARVIVTLHDYHLLCDAGTLLRPDGELCVFAEGRGNDGCSECIRRHPILNRRWSADDKHAQDLDALWSRAALTRLEKHRSDLAEASAIISPSRFLAERFDAAGFLVAEECSVMKAGYPGPLHAPRTRDASRPLRVGYVGGLYPAKGVDVLVRAFGLLQVKDAELHVHGHLDWFPEYVSDLERTAVGASVEFHGPFDPTELDSILANLDVLVVPSVWVENMPITIQEAFRNGIPVITTDLGGMREAVEHDVSGLTFPRGDESALAACIDSLSRDAALYDRLAAGRPRVPTLEEIVDRLEEVYAG